MTRYVCWHVDSFSYSNAVVTSLLNKKIAILGWNCFILQQKYIFLLEARDMRTPEETGFTLTGVFMVKSSQNGERMWFLLVLNKSKNLQVPKAIRLKGYDLN